ncbi:MAG: DUF4004 family protein [Ruminococcaceae bacterium]|nr:DUF4004 family protein [Oscillospiraceae bacterium]
MDDHLISKKELLERYSISYGALYRWKRMGLIPEEWFLKRSAVTGQETFFPADLICQRIELIQSQKDVLSLEELAQKLKNPPHQQATLLIHSVFGERRFSLNEIHSVILDFGNGTTVDLTELIKTQLKERN